MAFQLWSRGDLRRDEPHTGQGTLHSTSNMLDGIRTFADLDCNAGYFTRWLCHQLKSTQLKGLMVDAHALFLNRLMNLWFVISDTNGFYRLQFPKP
jgi:hypothetical protein